MDNLISKIQSMNLTKTEKVIADYILDNINNIGLSTVTDISLKLGVSDTSIIRFIRLLGFAWFADFIIHSAILFTNLSSKLSIVEDKLSIAL